MTNQMSPLVEFVLMMIFSQFFTCLFCLKKIVLLILYSIFIGDGFLVKNIHNNHYVF